MMQHRLLLLAILQAAVLTLAAQQPWTLQQCMTYAVEHNHDVRQATLQLDSYRAARLAAAGRFLPSVDASAGVQYNFGRAIDPETNTYTDVSTFYNGYALSASVPLFDGFSRHHALQAAKADVLMGREALRCRQDETALATLQAYVDACYYAGTTRMAEERLQESQLLLRQTQLLVEVGRKSGADLAQMESQLAEADYELTRQQNLRTSAQLTLRKEMALPLSEPFAVEAFFDSEDTLHTSPSTLHTSPSTLHPSPSTLHPQHPTLLQSYHALQSARAAWQQARADLLPTLSLGLGVNTTYYKTLHQHTSSSFSQQFRNNMGEYVALSLSIPVFNRLQTVTSIRRAKNNYLIAREAYAQRQLELQKLYLEALNDLAAARKQTLQMQKKVEADSLAYQLTRRQFEEGLSTAIDLHTTSAQLLQSRATLLQCRLLTLVKHYLTRYYRGEQIW